jgi:hypothetical protein
VSVVVWLQFGSAACAFVAAGFWAWSAASKAPEMTFHGIGDLTPWLNQSARRNRWAAGFAGASALFAGIATLFGVT